MPGKRVAKSRESVVRFEQIPIGTYQLAIEGRTDIAGIACLQLRAP